MRRKENPYQRFFAATAPCKQGVRVLSANEKRLAKEKRHKEVSPRARGDRPFAGGWRQAFEKA
ncbi:MAG: hypothetical protein ACI3X1_06690 [Eubacteriales bacterium]